MDRLAEGFDFARPAGYAAFLQGHAAALPALEHALEAGGVEDVLPDWPLRRRTDALRGDLAALGAAPPAAVDIGQLEGRAEMVGVLYVLEGSRLGGAVLRRRLMAVQPAAPAAYLSHGTGLPLWRSFLDWLSADPLAGADAAAALTAAREAFRAFEAGFQAAVHRGP